MANINSNLGKKPNRVGMAVGIAMLIAFIAFGETNNVALATNVDIDKRSNDKVKISSHDYITKEANDIARYTTIEDKCNETSNKNKVVNYEEIESNKHVNASFLDAATSSDMQHSNPWQTEYWTYGPSAHAPDGDSLHHANGESDDGGSHSYEHNEDANKAGMVKVEGVHKGEKAHGGKDTFNIGDVNMMRFNNNASNRRWFTKSEQTWQWFNSNGSNRRWFSSNGGNRKYQPSSGNYSHSKSGKTYDQTRGGRSDSYSTGSNHNNSNSGGNGGHGVDDECDCPEVVYTTAIYNATDGNEGCNCDDDIPIKFKNMEDGHEGDEECGCSEDVYEGVGDNTIYGTDDCECDEDDELKRGNKEFKDYNSSTTTPTNSVNDPSATAPGYGNTTTPTTGVSDPSNTAPGYGNTTTPTTGVSDPSNTAPGYGNTTTPTTGVSDPSNTAPGYGNTTTPTTGVSDPSNTAPGYGNTTTPTTGVSDPSNTAPGYGNNTTPTTGVNDPSATAPGYGNNTTPTNSVNDPSSATAFGYGSTTTPTNSVNDPSATAPGYGNNTTPTNSVNDPSSATAFGYGSTTTPTNSVNDPSSATAFGYGSTTTPTTGVSDPSNTAPGYVNNTTPTTGVSDPYYVAAPGDDKRASNGLNIPPEAWVAPGSKTYHASSQNDSSPEPKKSDKGNNPSLVSGYAYEWYNPSSASGNSYGNGYNQYDQSGNSYGNGYNQSGQSGNSNSYSEGGVSSGSGNSHNYNNSSSTTWEKSEQSSSHSSSEEGVRPAHAYGDNDNLDGQYPRLNEYGQWVVPMICTWVSYDTAGEVKTNNDVSDSFLGGQVSYSNSSSTQQRQDSSHYDERNYDYDDSPLVSYSSPFRGYGSFIQKPRETGKHGLESASFDEYETEDRNNIDIQHSNEGGDANPSFITLYYYTYDDSDNYGNNRCNCENGGECTNPDCNGNKHGQDHGGYKKLHNGRNNFRSKELEVSEKQEV
ncbi:hypothetical protein BgAZ_400450 [Babesia gibsoni]|uniref:Uncharacterized protein n=1 Tax=Babesia gibsoni TaxID=33632 RepID=A0AAD8LR34_BABGI|nr:hypothetical protein BgAZ_400450 [Babesia gibsoni]